MYRYVGILENKYDEKRGTTSMTYRVWLDELEASAVSFVSLGAVDVELVF